MPLTQGEIYFGPGSDTIHTIDLGTGARRSVVREDVRRFAQLVDILPNISFAMSMGTPVDVPEADHYLHAFIEMLRGTTKPIVFTANDRRDMEHIWKIACAAAGGENELRRKPFLLNYSEPISPLRFAPNSVQKLLFCAEHGIPVTFPPSPNMGGGGPVTMAGALALGNAEILAGLTLTQLKQRGALFLYGANVAALDMRSMVVCYGAPEWSLSMAALNDMARYYGLPSWGYGGASDAKIIDAQAGLEAMQSIYTAYLSRATLVHDVGYIESGLTSSLEMLCLADEIIGMVAFIHQGLVINEETLALDAIDAAQPGAGFLTAEHTLRNWREALYVPRLLDRQRYDHWEKRGKLDMYARLNQRVKQLLLNRVPLTLPTEVDSAIDAVLAQRSGGG